VATIEDLALAATVHCSVRGRITRCGDSASGLRVVCLHRQHIGFPDENERCRAGLPTFRTVGDGHTDGNGEFAFAFDAVAEPFGACAFSSLVHVELYDGATRIWVSGYRPVAPSLRFDRELLPNCTAGSTVVRVVDDGGNIVAGAEVFANGMLRGKTDATGHIYLDPPLEAGDKLVARLLIRENSTPKDGHDVDSSQNWNHRVWITSLGVRYDSLGNHVRLPQLLVSDPDDVQELRVRAPNALIGLNLRASIEWDASPTEFERIRDRLCDYSELLYNATDGQFLVAELALSDDGQGWDDADIRIYANLNQPSRGSFAGIFESDGRIRMNPNDAYFAGEYLHESGHYVFDLRDEYPDEGTIVCTSKSTGSSGPYADGGEKDACLMRGSQYKDQKKFCSAHPANPHAQGTRQGTQDCWTDILERYSDPDRRWRLLTPTSRGIIVGRLPDSGVPLRGSSEPPGVPRPPSFIPVAGWKPHVHELRVNHVGLCERLIVRVRRDDKPVFEAFVMLHTSQGRSVYQGQTKARYRLAYDVTSVAGEIPVRGAHLGDDISVYEFHGPAFVQIGRKRIETCTGRLVVDASTALSVAVKGASPALSAPPAAAPVIRSVWPADQTVLESHDGRLRIVLPPDALAEPGLVHLEEGVRADVPDREHIASGPYALTGPTEGRLKTQAHLRFVLPPAEARTYGDLHVVRFEADGSPREIASSVTQDPFGVTAAIERFGTYVLVDRRT
jgi:hypothetical protein